jgi:hypothetical protein
MRAPWHRILSLILFVGLVLGMAGPAAADEKLFLETIGGFCGNYIYTTYAYIGAVADLYAKDMYPASEVKVMMDQNVQMIDKLSVQLELVRDANISDNDRKFIINLIDILSLLKSEAEGLSAFTASKSPDDLDRYDQARKKVYPKMKKLLGMK